MQRETFRPDSSHLEALNNYGVLLLRHRNYRNAIVFFEKATYEPLGRASAEGKLNEAARAFRQARDLDESNVQECQATCNLAHHITWMVQSEADPEARARKLEQAEHMSRCGRVALCAEILWQVLNGPLRPEQQRASMDRPGCCV
eukprot:753632-Hanusia_phi.AAC.2